jgi:hypothetical protein
MKQVFRTDAGGLHDENTPIADARERLHRRGDSPHNEGDRENVVDSPIERANPTTWDGHRLNGKSVDDRGDSWDDVMPYTRGGTPQFCGLSRPEHIHDWSLRASFHSRRGRDAGGGRGR